MSGDTKSLREILVFSDEDCEDMLRCAVDSYSNGELHHAEAILVGLIALSGGDSRPVKLLASTLMMEGKHEEAEELYERARKMDPDDPYVLVALGEIRLKSLKLADAMPVFEHLCELDPDGVNPAANRGRELLRLYSAKLAEAE